MAFYEENPSSITRAEMVVAIPSCNEAGTIGHTTMRGSQGIGGIFRWSRECHH